MTESQPPTTPPDDAVLTLAPRDPSTAPEFLRRGLVLQALGLQHDALEPLTWATVLTPTDTNAWLARCMSLSLLGRDEQSHHALLAAREVNPGREAMWFENDGETALEPLAMLSRAAFLAGVEERLVPAEATLDELVRRYKDVPVPRIQQVVANGMIMLAGLATGRDHPSAAQEHLAALVTRYADTEDARVRLCLASALLTLGALQLDGDAAQDAMVTWQRAVAAAEDDPAAQLFVARALRNQALVHDLSGRNDLAHSMMQSLADRFCRDPDPELRSRAADALRVTSVMSAESGDVAAADASARAIVDLYRHDTNPALARLVSKTRVELWLANRTVPRLVGQAVRWLAAREAAIRHRDTVGIDFPRPRDRPARRGLGWVLTVIGRLTQAVATLGGVTVAIRLLNAPDHTSMTVVLCAGLIMVGELVALLGQRLRGRFTIGVLRVTPARLPRTAAGAVIALLAAWLSPALERAGALYTFGPPAATYEWLLGIGLPVWAGAAAMLVFGPLEILILLGAFYAVVLSPLRRLLGGASPLVEALGDSFGSVQARPATQRPS